MRKDYPIWGLEKHDDWIPGNPVWRVVSKGTFLCGPFCHSRSKAIWGWFKFSIGLSVSGRNRWKKIS